MKQSIVEIVGVIERMISEHPEAPPSESAVRSWLKVQGYPKRDIDAALKAVRPQFPAGQPGAYPPAHRTVRPLNLYEDFKLTPEARNALARLELHGLITPGERELVLERLGQIEGEVGIDELDYLLSWLVYGGRGVEFQQTVYNILSGKGDTVH